MKHIKTMTFREDVRIPRLAEEKDKESIEAFVTDVMPTLLEFFQGKDKNSESEEE